MHHLDSHFGLNKHHARHLLATFRHLDELLSGVERVLGSASSTSPFREYADDASPVQRKVIHDHIARLRGRLGGVLGELDIPCPSPSCGALWAARNAVSFAGIALAELEPRRMQGYGKMSDAAAETMDGIVAELRAAIDALEEELEPRAGGDLAHRLRRLEGTAEAVGLLGELERIVTSHGLVQFRPAIAMLLDRLENRTFEIGVFGRVSSGKSSLLNHLLGADYLPVGVMPVTAFPTRITFGPRPRAVVEFLERPARVISLEVLAVFASEEQNPGNTKHVKAIRVEVAAPALREGVTFVDTPGLGSLAAAGAQETAAYLPRCDLGLVLVDGASTVTLEDLKTVQAIYRGGAKAMVLVSKADLLDPVDRERMLDYVRRQIKDQVEVDPSVDLLSVVGGEARLCEEWFATRLQPLFDVHRALADASFKRKVGGLREWVLAGLKRRLKPDVAESARQNRTQIDGAKPEWAQVRRTQEAARREVGDLARAVRALHPRILDAVAEELARSWSAHGSERVEPKQIFAAVSARILREQSLRVKRRIEEARSRLVEILDAASRTWAPSGKALQDLPRPGGLPVPDLPALTRELDLRRPVFAAWFGAVMLRRRLGALLRKQIGTALSDFLERYSRCLAPWAAQSLAALDAAFTVGADVVGGMFDRPGSTATGSGEEDLPTLRDDVRLLERWGSMDPPAPAKGS